MHDGHPEGGAGVRARYLLLRVGAVPDPLPGDVLFCGIVCNKNPVFAVVYLIAILAI